MLRRAFATLCCLLTLSACAREFKPTLAPPADLQARDYAAVLELWTRKDEAFSGLEHKITAIGTLITPMLRRVFSLRFPEVYGYGGKITRDEMREPQPASAPADSDTVNVFVGIYTPSFRWNDLQKPDSIWHVTMQKLDRAGGTALVSVDASSIDRVKVDENINTVYPYLSTFEIAYIAKFPNRASDGSTLLGPGENYLRMRIASSFAKSELEWTVLVDAGPR